MESSLTHARSAEALASRIEEDLHSQGLKPGDRYLTSEQARAKFAVRKGLINRSMQMLVDRNVLVRQRRSGTFVGPGFGMADSGTSAESSLRDVRVLMPMDYYRARTIPAERFVESINRIVPNAVAQVHCIPDAAAMDHVRRVVSELRDETGVGLVLIRTPRDAQLLIERSETPAIVFGSVYPDVGLASLDVDQVRSARLGVRYAVARGRRKFLLIMRDQWRRGDNLLLRGVTRELAACGIGLDSVEVASVPSDSAAIRDEIVRRLRQIDSTAILCRGTFAAQPVLEAITSAGVCVGNQVDVVNLGGFLEERPVCPTVVPAWPYGQQTNALIQELARIADNREPESPRNIAVPVSLIDEQGRPIPVDLGPEDDPAIVDDDPGLN